MGDRGELAPKMLKRAPQSHKKEQNPTQIKGCYMVAIDAQHYTAPMIASNIRQYHQEKLLVIPSCT